MVERPHGRQKEAGARWWQRARAVAAVANTMDAGRVGRHCTDARVDAMNTHTQTGIHTDTLHATQYLASVAKPVLLYTSSMTMNRKSKRSHSFIRWFVSWVMGCTDPGLEHAGGEDADHPPSGRTGTSKHAARRRTSLVHDGTSSSRAYSSSVYVKMRTLISGQHRPP